MAFDSSQRVSAPSFKIGTVMGSTAAASPSVGTLIGEEVPAELIPRNPRRLPGAAMER